MDKIITELNKKPGVCYAITADGVEMAVIDITNPAFRTDLKNEDMERLEAGFVAAQHRQAKIPRFIMNILYMVLLRKSVLGQAVMGSASGFLGGLHTYMMKLGGANLGRAYANKVDMAIADAFPSTAMRLRLRDMARMMADALAPQLKSNPGKPLYMIDIAGGPSPDCLNTLILLHKENPGILDSREITINVLDLKEDGPFFAINALKSLQEKGGPLEGARATCKYIKYDWNDAGEIGQAIGAGLKNNPITMISSEGGLFEYGSDEVICSNLTCLAQIVPAGTLVVGSQTRNEGPIKELKMTSNTPTFQRSLEEFSKLANGAGWQVIKSVSGVFSRNVLLGMEKL